MALRIQITKFKFHQHLLEANSPNLMLAKLSRYRVYYIVIIVYFLGSGPKNRHGVAQYSIHF